MPLLRRMEPERAHRLALVALRCRLAARDHANDDPILAVEALGLRFSNPIGLAAGFDKDAIALPALSRLGFGFIETGTVTRRPQKGNPRPRLFRLEPDRAVINRMGFNNDGIQNYVARLSGTAHRTVPIGANVGLNKEGADPLRDYPALVAAVSPHVNYVAINVSSPNTPGLRELQKASRLREILMAASEQLHPRSLLLVKIAPDLSPDDLAAIVEVTVEAGASGLIISNTTTSRPAGLISSFRTETGGLSGAPLFSMSTAILARAYRLARNRLCLVGVGGISSGEDAFAKIQAGASLVQLYTGFAYAGPGLIPRLKAELAQALRRAGVTRLQDAIGTEAERWAGAI
jgi:dihydroorotate dehydrogenase